MILIPIKIDVNKPYTVPIEINQRDTASPVFDITLLNGAEPVDLTASIVRFVAIKPDNHIIANECNITDAENGRCTYPVTSQTSIAAGKMTAQFVITFGEAEAEKHTQEFSITIKPSIDTTDAEESTDEFTDLQAALIAVAAVTGRLTALETDMAAAQEDIVSAQEDIANLETENAQLKSGWMPFTDAVTYVSATSFTVVGDKTSIFKKSRPLKWTQNGAIRESNIISASYSAGTGLTTVSKHAGYKSNASDCEVLNTISYPITNMFIGTNSAPDDFWEWFSWAPTYGATSPMTWTNPTTATATFCIKNCLLHFVIFAKDGTAGGTASSRVTFTVPVNRSGIESYLYVGAANVYNNGGTMGYAIWEGASRNIIGVFKYNESSYVLGSSNTNVNMSAFYKI